MAIANPVAWRAENIDTTTIESRIADLWKQLSGESPEVVPVRTHLFNLVVYAGDSNVDERVLKKITSLRQRHPSRTIVLITDRLNPQSCVDAEVTVLCGPAAEGSPAYCEERVIVTAHGRAADHPSSLVLSLLVPQLPTYLWWPGQPPFGHRMFHRLLSTANQLVVDSSHFDSPGDGFAALAGICMGEQGVNDFHWSRLEPWREIVAQFFDGESHIPYAAGIQSIAFEFGSGSGVGTGRSATSGVLLMLGWLASRLGWRPETTIDRPFSRDVTMAVLRRERVIPIDIRFKDHGEKAAGRLMRLQLESQPADRQSAKCDVMRLDDLRTVHVSAEFPGESRLVRVVPLVTRGDEEILTAELQLTGHDRLYQEVVRMASSLAGREVLTPA